MLSATKGIAINRLRGVGPGIAKRFEKLGIKTVQDLLFHLPRAFEDRTRIYPLTSLQVGDSVTIEGTISQVQRPIRAKTRLLIRLQDASGFVMLRFFFAHSNQIKTLVEGTKLRCFGEVRLGRQGREIVHPEYEVIEDSQSKPLQESLTPIYPATEGLSQKKLRQCMAQALVWLEDDAPKLNDVVFAKSIDDELPSLIASLKFIHNPTPDTSIELLKESDTPQQTRLSLDELVAHQLSVLKLRQAREAEPAPVMAKSTQLAPQLIASLPFKLTGAQARAVAEVEEDLANKYPMARLVQGDVGSGKTIVAALAALQAIESGFQVAIMAPTEILAEQHFEHFSEWFAPLDLKVTRLVSKLKTAEKKAALEEIELGNTHVVVGTQALFQSGVEFKSLGLVVIDEQHRFGVGQRLALRAKGEHTGFTPHQLIMTATPIPRTLAMVAYADLSHSVIDELPPGRTPVKTAAIPDSRRQDVVARIKHAVSEGRQVYWVCTLIEESEALASQAAEETCAQLQTWLPEACIGLVHGRMRAEEKEKTMLDFKEGKLHVLVATTVIEVGVNVPNASLMIIENPERLGLAQLHQLRGRVGRGHVESFCVLLYRAPLTDMAKARLDVLRKSTDGFDIAKKDLELRGPGELLGKKQTGLAQFRVAHLIRDQHWFPHVRKVADTLLKEHPQEAERLIERWVGERMAYIHA